jgi:hypothetical protein
VTLVMHGPALERVRSPCLAGVKRDLKLRTGRAVNRSEHMRSDYSSIQAAIALDKLRGYGSLVARMDGHCCNSESDRVLDQVSNLPPLDFVDSTRLTWAARCP